MGAATARDAVTMSGARDEWGTRSAGKAYREWLRRGKVVVPAPEAAEWIEEAEGRMGSVRELAGWVGCTEHALRDIADVGRATVDILSRLAEAAGFTHELEEIIGPPGIEGWSTMGTYCGDGRDDLAGCGTFFHDHHQDGLCKECHGGLGDPSFVPRDVRLAKVS